MRQRLAGATPAGPHGWGGGRGMRATSRPQSAATGGNMPQPARRSLPPLRRPGSRGTTQGRVVAMQLDLHLEQATELIRQTLVLALVVSAPMLLIGLAVGIVISLVQAVTQIQDQTLSLIPKIVAM